MPLVEMDIWAKYINIKLFINMLVVRYRIFNIRIYYLTITYELYRTIIM